MNHNVKEQNGNQIVTELPKSMIAVMDIMGFSSVLENNDTAATRTSVQRAISKCLDKIGESGKLDHILSKVKDKKDMLDAIDNNRKKMSQMQFSDTHIFVMPNLDKTNEAQLMAFFLTVSIAVEHFYCEGFPVRCRIEFGDCLFNSKHNILIGASLVRAHRKTEDMGYSGIEISEKVIMKAFGSSSSGKFKDLLKRFGIMKCSVFDKEGNSGSEYCLDWHCGSYDAQYDKNGLRQELIEKFTMHGKQLNKQVVQRIDNTEIHIREFWCK